MRPRIGGDFLWDPHEHPREYTGKFRDKPGTGKPREKLPSQERPAPVSRRHVVSEWAKGVNPLGRPEGTGTEDDPIDVGKDLDRAVQLLAEGKHVRLRQPKQVSTLVDKLREVSTDAVARGEQAPNYDLCKISVPKTNLFCAQHKGIPRAKMPQLSGRVPDGAPGAAYRKDPNDPGSEADIAEPFVQALTAQGIPVIDKRVPASQLRASQMELDGPKVAGIANFARTGGLAESPIFVTRDGYVIDGHHRWAALMALDTEDGHLGDIDMPVREVDLDIGAAIDFANAFALSMGIRPKGLGAAAEAVKRLARLLADTPVISQETKAVQNNGAGLFRINTGRAPLSVPEAEKARTEYLALSKDRQDQVAQPVMSIKSALSAVAERIGGDGDRIHAAVRAGMLGPYVGKLIQAAVKDLEAALTNQEVPADLRAQAMAQLVDVLVASEIESWASPGMASGAKSLIDEGDLVSTLLASHPERPFTSGDRAMALWTAAMGDLGNLTPLPRLGYSGHQEKHGKAYYDAEVKVLTTGLFGSQADLVGKAIATGRSENLEDDPVLAAFRVADHLSMFAEQKTPALLRAIPEAIAPLEDLAAGEIDQVTATTEIKAQIASAVLHERIPTMVAIQLTTAAETATIFKKELAGHLPTGKLTDVRYTPMGRITARMVRTPGADRVSALFGGPAERGFRWFAKKHGAQPERLMLDGGMTLGGLDLIVDGVA